VLKHIWRWRANLLGGSKVADKILNTGLDALLGDVATPNKQTIKEIELDKIKPNRFQPRQSFDEQKINELSQSISKHGILSPILVRETGAGGYELIAGERRLRAAKEAGLKTAPCMVDSAEDQLSLELALIENLQREDLNPIEEARGYDRLKREFSLTQDKIAEVTGKARSSVANSMRLLNLPPSVIDLLYSGDLEKGHAKILASMGPNEAEALAQKIVSLGMTVKDAATSTKPSSTKTKTKTKNRDLLNIEEELSESIGHKIEIDQQSALKGRVSISYSSKDERESIISKLLKLKKN
jgi:ParB family chromosome partitioning protein